jgi:Protein of unknown function (DUF1566)
MPRTSKHKKAIQRIALLALFFNWPAYAERFSCTLICDDDNREATTEVREAPTKEKAEYAPISSRSCQWAVNCSPIEEKSNNPPQSTKGIPAKYSATAGNPACLFFDDYIDNGDGTVTDPRSGLIWKRCAEGFDWNGQRCTGTKYEADWFDAMKRAKNSRFLQKSDWRLPTTHELSSVVSTGGDSNNSDACSSNDNGKGQYSVSLMMAHPVNEKSPGTFWSSTAAPGDSTTAWVTGFIQMIEMKATMYDWCVEAAQAVESKQVTQSLLENTLIKKDTTRPKLTKIQK